jgi:hypothetical protein
MAKSGAEFRAIGEAVVGADGQGRASVASAMRRSRAGLTSCARRWAARRLGHPSQQVNRIAPGGHVLM